MDSDIDGEALSKYIRVGKYYYRASELPEGYVLDATVYDFTLSENYQILDIEYEIEK